MIQTLGELGQVLSASEVALLGLLSLLCDITEGRRDSTTLYRAIRIPKKSGGYRDIQAPCKELELVQAAIYRWLFSEVAVGKANNGSQVAIQAGSGMNASDFNHSIISNARFHVAKKYVFNVDIQDYFGSIVYENLNKVLSGVLSHLVSQEIITSLCNLLTLRGSLPQGSPCSPFVAYLCTRQLDFALMSLANEHQCTYSRYMDDISISTDSRDFPARVAIQGRINRSVWSPSDELIAIFKAQGFNLNEKKTRMMYRTSRQCVTGLVVNSKVAPSKEYKRITRAMIHSLISRGSYYSASSDGGETVSINASNFHQRVKSLRARASYLANAELKHRAQSREPGLHSDAVLNMCRKLTIFCAMYCLERTTIIWKKPKMAALLKELCNHPVIHSDTQKWKLKILRFTPFLKQLFEIDKLSKGWLSVLSLCIETAQSFQVAYPSAKPLIFMVDVRDWVAAGLESPDLECEFGWMRIGVNVYVLWHDSPALRSQSIRSNSGPVQPLQTALQYIKEIESHLLQNPVVRKSLPSAGPNDYPSSLGVSSQDAHISSSGSSSRGRVLIFDTETNGLPANFRLPESDTSNWPRIVQVAWVLAEPDGTVFHQFKSLVKPSGFTIPLEAVRVHGITTEMALQHGNDLNWILDEFVKVVNASETVVAHNAEFDRKVIGSEFIRCGRSNPLSSKPIICTMVNTTGLLKLPGSRGYKWPKLEELHKFLFGTSFAGAHDALADVNACRRCYFRLLSRGHSLSLLP